MISDEPFRLANDQPTAKPLSFENSERTRQRVLFSGLDCLPGQLDLFDTDGSDTDQKVNLGEMPNA